MVRARVEGRAKQDYSFWRSNRLRVRDSRGLPTIAHSFAVRVRILRRADDPQCYSIPEIFLGFLSGLS